MRMYALLNKCSFKALENGGRQYHMDSETIQGHIQQGTESGNSWEANSDLFLLWDENSEFSLGQDNDSLLLITFLQDQSWNILFTNVLHI
jgi:hypothetical protein